MKEEPTDSKRLKKLSTYFSVNFTLDPDSDNLHTHTHTHMNRWKLNTDSIFYILGVKWDF